MQQKRIYGKAIINGLFVAFLFFGCHKNKSSIELQTVTQTSENLNCEKIFNKTRKSIIELNEILVQTGTIETNNEFPQAAIIHVGDKEIILNLDNSQRHGTSVIEIYKGKGYKIVLTYEPEQFTHAEGYKGYLEIWNGSEHDKFAVQGIVNNL